MLNSPSATHTPNSFMDTFDFGNPDFSATNSGIDDINSIFPANGASSSHNPQSEAGSAPVSHHPSPSVSFNHTAGTSDSNPNHNAGGLYLNNSSHASSPLALSRNRFDNHPSASPQAGSSNPAASEQGHNGHASSANSNANFGADFYGAPSMQSSHSAQSQQNDQSGQMPQLSIQDLQQMLMERERTERIQNMQTALLKQQLDQLARVQQQQRQQQQHQQQQQMHQQQQQQQMQSSGSSSNLQLNLGGSAGQLSPGQQQSLLMALQNAFAQGNNPSAHNNVLQAAQYQQQQQGQNAWQQQQNGGQGATGNGGDQSNVLAQYGLITPMGSGPFNSAACPPGSANFMSPLAIQPNSHPGSVGVEQRPGHDYLGNYTPLESPAVTPASVFSTGSTGIVMSELFSPLTSPALGPQSHSLNEIMLPPASMQHHQQAQAAGMLGSPAIQAVQNYTPTASPLALIAKGSSKIRKNRSTTAEARANKVRPSPLIKPVSGPGIKKKKDAAAAALASPSTSTPLANGGSSAPSSRRASITAAPAAAVESNTHSRHQSTEAGQSEGTSSTPSPIDLSGGGAMPPPSGSPKKILTPSSIMGMRSSPGGAGGAQGEQRQVASPSSARAPPSSGALKGKARDDFQQQQQQQQMLIQQQQQQQQQQQGMGMAYANIAPFPGANAGGAGPKVTFNLPPQMGGMPTIQPGGLSQADRDAWMNYKSAGGLESRRTSHKAAEQKRRDSLKFCFDELRGLLPAIMLDEDAPNGSLLGPDGLEEDREAEQFDPAEVGDPEQARQANRAISKVALLRHSNEYLVRLKKRLERRDRALEVCRKEVEELRRKLGLAESEDPSVTGKGAPIGWTDDDAKCEYREEGPGAGEEKEEAKVEMDQSA